ncbi:hypothetical protein PVAND_007308 [Polypedilum vanderplanki]|uniref:Uncharacterized protein n=1 Tax=Polypedilum vanderplanki TaxID=319348 RepID=A0A9J6C7F0_POLVA|nr:hypothetical protein PVAND_007308 [Polypedilum vanderplanki]
MKKLIDNIVAKNKSIEETLKLCGLENIKIEETIETEISGSKKFHDEIELCNTKSTLSQMERNNKKIMNEIEQSKKTIKLLNECLDRKVNVSEMKQASIKRQIALQKLKSQQQQQYTNENIILKIIQQLKELEP